MQFTDAASLISGVESRLRSYVAANLVDTGEFYSLLKKEMGRMGLSLKEETEWVLAVKNHRVLKPADMVDFWSIHELEDPEASSGSLLRYIPPSRARQVSHQAERNSQIHRQSPCRSHHYHRQFTEDGHYFRFDFTDSYVLVQGWGTPRHNGSILVPAEPILTDYLEKFLIYQTLKDLYINAEVNDLERRLDLAKRDYELAEAVATNYLKTPSFKQLLAWKESWHGRLLSRYQL
ncbi:hypothetical protein GCM10028806_34120 [Spirosoma terrae]|uniref:Uncharacterized protein n=1 Tax=Spirosoma terrae TaxID=1968276 RepID=A0A6L9L525_9BACT|nr:hypothetical protein [Spirosoma terrae]NDU95725.1 hypothetical protein [Spirosoma terrae]